LVKGFASAALIGVDVRVLKLNRPTIKSLHVRDVSFTVLCVAANLLPLSGKLVFPGAVPRRFWLPVASALAFVSPVPNSNPAKSTLCNHGFAAFLALTTYKTRLRFALLSVHEGEFHLSVSKVVAV
jgi:hypothetical protein